MTVKNVPNTSGLTCNCKSWLDHWEKFGGKKADYCVVNGCSEKATVGAHIKVLNDSNYTETYILPMCQGHNQTDKELIVRGGFPLVSADPKKTCAKN